MVSNGEYSRTVRIGDISGVVRVSRQTSEHLVIDASDALDSFAENIVERIERLFDVSADPRTIDAHLADNGLRASVDRAQGVRVPGAFDGFELAVRAILGQQVTVKGASTLMSRLTNTFGEAIECEAPELTHLAATASRLASASPEEIREIGIPNARAATLHAIASHVASGALDLDAPTNGPTLVAQLVELPGIGPWTADYIAMRVAKWSDSFPASDIALRHALGDASPRAMSRMAERWRPYRAYAAMRLWLHGSVDANSLAANDQIVR